MKKTIMAIMLSSSLLCASDNSIGLDTIIGGVAGVALGNQIGSGNGRTVAKVAGGLIGAGIANGMRDNDNRNISTRSYNNYNRNYNDNDDYRPHNDYNSSRYNNYYYDQKRYYSEPRQEYIVVTYYDQYGRRITETRPKYSNGYTDGYKDGIRDSYYGR